MRLPKLERRPELDALRGLFILLMVTVHLPTRLSNLVNQPLGYVSSAVGFVGLSAVLLGRIYFGEFVRDAARARLKIWRRSLQIYGYHLVLLGLAFTVAASYAEQTNRPAILNLLHFYFHHPVIAVAGSLLLLYCPPLLDVLPLFIVFMLLTPLILSAARRFGWKLVLAASALVWAGAQFGLRGLVYHWIFALVHLPIPLQQTGSFNLLAWQAVWVAGLWLGARSAEGVMPLDRLPRWALPAAAAACLFFLAVRHGWLGATLGPTALGMHFDKWQMEPLRVLNIAAFVVVAWWLRKYVVALIAHEPLLTLGKVSLQVFCAHLFFVFTGLALLAGDRIHLRGPKAIVLVAVTYPALIAIAYWLQARKRRAARASRAQAPAPGAPAIPPLVESAGIAPSEEAARSEEFDRYNPPRQTRDNRCQAAPGQTVGISSLPGRSSPASAVRSSLRSPSAAPRGPGRNP